MGDLRNALIITVISLCLLLIPLFSGISDSSNLIKEGTPLYKISIDRNQLALSAQEKLDIPDSVAVNFWAVCSRNRDVVKCGQREVGVVHDTGALARMLRGTKATVIPSEDLDPFLVGIVTRGLVMILLHTIVTLVAGVAAEKTDSFIAAGIATVSSILGLGAYATVIEVYIVRPNFARKVLEAVTPGTTIALGAGFYAVVVAGVVDVFAGASFLHACVLRWRRIREAKAKKLGALSI